MQQLAEKRGITLYVGDLDDPSRPKPEPSGPDTAPLDVTSRIIAHLGHRIPGVKKIEKRFEGQDKNSGILSDITSLFANLFERNEDLIGGVIVDALAGKGINLPISLTPDSPPQDAVYDFGEVDPVETHNHHEER